MALTPRTLWQPLSYLLIFGLLAGVYVLPPDTSLREVRRGGVLRACMPPLYPPLITSDPAAPGIDVELLQALTKAMGLRLAITPNQAMGQDFNPRNWHVTRAQCEVLAGGVVASPVTRSFLETSPPYAETGWAFIQPKPFADMQGRRAGVLIGISGLDRIALSRYLRSRNIDVTIAPDATELATGLRQGRFEFGVTEKLLAGQIGSREGWNVMWAPAELPRYPLVLGLWKGDITLKRALVDGLDTLEKNGDLARIINRYLTEGKTGQPAKPAAALPSPGTFIHPALAARSFDRPGQASW
jgi:polar amino acid transport system substrate-binding protein/cystine transport system substrate-binding protein/membrane-bound lytic murein transglycosylase F